MKISRFNHLAKIDEDKNILYNTFTRNYLVFDNDKKNMVKGILENVSRTQFDVLEAEIVKKLIKKQFIIHDDIEELDIIKYNEANTNYQDQYAQIVILTTMDCNFRCVYCFEKHKPIYLDDNSIEAITNYVDKVSKLVNRLKIVWFGGEPMLMIDKIEEMTRDFKEICKKNDCVYVASMTTNGYFLNKEYVDRIKQLSIEKIQITLDGNKESHDKQRPLKNGEGTFEVIKDNIRNLVINEDIRITFRINVTEENYDNIHEIFDIIPKDKRKKVNLVMVNIFQNDGKLNLFKLYKEAIDLGYIYNNTYNVYSKCESEYKRGIAITPDLKVSPCAGCYEVGMNYGELKDTGDIFYKNIGFYYKFQTLSVFDSENCRNCIRLPICMGGCKFKRYMNRDICNGLIPDGLSLNEKILLHYHNDLTNNKEIEAI